MARFAFPAPAIFRRTVLTALPAALLLGLVATAPVAAAEKTPQAPFGDKVSAAIYNYNRALPYVGTSGAYPASAVAEVKALGFVAVVELRAPGEKGVREVAEAARKAGLAYYNIPVTTKAPTDAQVAEFAKIVDDPANWPVLVNCHSANRAGAMWALYRAAKGVPVEVAIEEGRTVGLKPSREVAVRARLTQKTSAN